MSIWSDIQDRSSGETVRKEELIPITLKVTKREPYYDWNLHQLRLSYENEAFIIKVPFDSWLYDYDAAYELKEHGVDIKEMSYGLWQELRTGGDKYKPFRDWLNKQWDDAKEGGSSYLRYTYRKRHLDGIYWEVTITLHMFGQTRKVKFVSSCRYETVPSEETLHNYVFDLLRDCFKDHYKDTRIYFSKEEWEDNNTFKKLMEGGRQTCQWYNNGEYSHFSLF